LTPLAMKDLLEAGAHFGHQTKRWNPKMKPFIFGERSGIYILDLGKTVKLYNEAEHYVRNLAAEGKTILFVGTKRQAQDVVAEMCACFEQVLHRERGQAPSRFRPRTRAGLSNVALQPHEPGPHNCESIPSAC